MPPSTFTFKSTWRTGINTCGFSSNVTDGRVFGYEVGYENRFTKIGRNYSTAQFNGNISGMVWKSDGDDYSRKYDFTYDAANRLMKANFEQRNDDNGWGNGVVNFNVIMGNGSDPNTAYDANGNIKRMQQWGMKLTGRIQYLYKNKKSRTSTIYRTVNGYTTLVKVE